MKARHASCRLVESVQMCTHEQDGMGYDMTRYDSMRWHVATA